MNMKNVLTSKTLVFAFALTSILGCQRGQDPNIDQGTGWRINAKEGGFQYNTNFSEQETPPGTVFVEGGTFTMGRVQDDVMHDWNNSPNQQHVQSFYMDETEVTNKMYLHFLDWIEEVYPPEEDNFKNIYNGVVPDTLVWRNRLGYNDVMTNNYLRHPAYASYPVVGVSWIQAVEYAEWRTDRVNEQALQKAGYLKQDSHLEATADQNFSTDTYINSPTSSFGGNDDIIKGGKLKPQLDADGNEINVFASRETGLISPKYRLPSETEWEYAALGLSEIRSYNAHRGRKKYPWEGAYTRTGNRKVRGDQMANFKQGKGDYGGIAGWSDDGADITAPARTYDPNDFGLYDMAGNVAEWVADVYRPIVDDEFNDFNYYRGNVYTKNKLNEDGSVKIVTPDEIVYDTMPNGKLIARDLPGEISQIPVDEDETYLRTNFDRADNRNFRDGDTQSSRHYDKGFDDEEADPSTKKSDTGKMYNSPKHNIEFDSIGGVVREWDKNNKRTSLINDEVRVYKGGSWKDREYWLDPAQRRYYPQNKATDYIGFRCAMSRVGSKSKGPKKKN